jgi:SpoVK/Ycf46/Vps4 family AAA+-type ATPase
VELPDVARDDLVLDQDVWDAVDENVHGMFRAAAVLREADLGARRGLLIAGPPGVGKSALCRIVGKEIAGTATVLIADMSVSS